MRESGLLATCLPIIMPAVVVVVVVVSQETTLHKFKLQSFPPFLTPPPPFPPLYSGCGKVSSDQTSPLLFPVKTPSSSSTFLKQKFTQRPAVNLLIYIELRSFSFSSLDLYYYYYYYYYYCFLNKISHTHTHTLLSAL